MISISTDSWIRSHWTPINGYPSTSNWSSRNFHDNDCEVVHTFDGFRYLINFVNFEMSLTPIRWSRQISIFQHCPAWFEILSSQTSSNVKDIVHSHCPFTNMNKILHQPIFKDSKIFAAPGTPPILLWNRTLRWKNVLSSGDFEAETWLLEIFLPLGL